MGGRAFGAFSIPPMTQSENPPLTRFQIARERNHDVYIVEDGTIPRLPCRCETWAICQCSRVQIKARRARSAGCYFFWWVGSTVLHA
eukprot:scaffold40386_cov252-Amphora_coffeaeformis.AAC.1